MQQRIGIGYDIHRFEKGRKLILGGVEIPHHAGLSGHSDADVLLHALCDAILGALGLGDIGEHFPNTDDTYKNISSLILLDEVKSLMENQGFTINNVDCVLQAQEPNLSDFKPAIKNQIAIRLGIEDSLINVKATTMEGLGSIGNKEGMGAFVSVILNRE